MPGLSFLFKKKFHPRRFDQQKRVYIVEEETSDRMKSEKDRADQIRKEQELFQQHHSLKVSSENDPKNNALHFLYNIPNQLKDNKNNDGKPNSTNSAASLLQPPPPPKLDENGDDEQVRAWKLKYLQQQPPPEPEQQQQSSNNEKEEEELESDENIISTDPRTMIPTNVTADSSSSVPPNQSSFTARNSLERELGIRKESHFSHEEQVSRHPKLKNAPVEGSFVSGKTQLKHKPFFELIRNVRCARCGEWGHQSGDRECRLLHFNPLDVARQLREDPMSAITRYDSLLTANNQPRINNSNNNNNNIDHPMKTIMAADFDPEEEFLNSLTRREKKLLLRKLTALEENLQEKNNNNNNGKKSKKNNNKNKKKRKRKKNSTDNDNDNESDNDNSDSDSSSSSSSFSSSFSAEDDHKRKKSKKHKATKNQEDDEKKTKKNHNNHEKKKKIDRDRDHDYNDNHLKREKN
jgi:hypothetical protein